MRLAVISFTPRGTDVCRRLVETLADLGHGCTGYIPEKYAREMEKNTGRPEGNTGELEKNAGRPEENTGEPEKNAGGPEGNTGEQEKNIGEPEGNIQEPGRILVRREPLAVWTERVFPAVDGLIFISAAGIAVRAVAPWVRDKMTDPAVVVVDEGGRFAISLLSGHLGGANALARQVAEALGAQPVITTASDVEGMYAVDLWARDHGLVTGDRVQARQVQAAILEGSPVEVFWEPWLEACLPWLGREPLPQGWRQSSEPHKGQKARIWITVNYGDGTGEMGILGKAEFHGGQKNLVLRLVPPILTLGIGCRRGVPEEEIRKRVQQVFAQAGLDPAAVCRIASIDRKKEEPGILALAGHWQVPYVTFTAAELETVEQPVEESDFVRSVTGTGNVCERAALLAAGEHSRLVVTKQAGDGITVAVAVGSLQAQDDHLNRTGCSREGDKR